MKQGKRSIRILIADDHVMFCEGLKAMLCSQPGFDVVGESRDGDETCKLVERLKPDILLLDLSMPKVGGIDALRSLAASHHKTRTILLGEDVEGEAISKAFELGVRGVVLKLSSISTLFKGIHAVMDGQYWIGGQSFASPMEALKQYKNKAKKAPSKNYGLTPREMEIVKAVVSGSSNKEIAGLHHISEQTVKHHITSIFDKLGVYNRLELTLFAFHHALIEK